MNRISIENNIQVTFNQRARIFKVFIEIDRVLEEVDNSRKRMISIKYIIMQLFKMLGLPYKGILITKSKRTFTYYEDYWAKIELLIGDRINSILQL